jgi:hypothetical protein
VRNPVSSKCATSASARYSVIAFRAGASSPVILRAPGRQRAGRRGAAEHLGKGLAGAVAGQELAVPQADPGAHEPRPVLHRRGHPVRGIRFRLAPAAAQQRQHLVPGGLRPDPGDADGWSVSSVVTPGWPFGRPGFRPDFPRSDFGAGFASPSDDGGLPEFRESGFTCAARSATCDCSPASASRSTAISASCTAIRSFRSASSSRSRAFAARSPAASSGTPAGRSGHSISVIVVRLVGTSLLVLQAKAKQG